jgi:predicted DNA-binding protein with PD1-like motif
LNRYDKLPDALIAVARKFNVQAGRITAIGGVTQLKVSEFDLEAGKYKEPLERRGMTEVLGLHGNLSLRDGEIFPHLHINACWHEDGRTQMISGHLVEAEVFVCEFHLTAYEDALLVREIDAATGLALWNLPNEE